jgi:Mg2+-importing ATPase
MFMGTNILAGEGTGEVQATGSGTRLGKVSEHLVAPRPKTDFEIGINAFGLLLMRTAIIVCIFVFSAHLLFAHNIWSSLLFVLALAIGFAPELLPMVVTINLSRGALRMSKRGVIVKSLPSIENFGSMDILATDKTGTLTENRIVLERYEDVAGVSSAKVLQYGYLGSIFQSGFHGPMEEAILAHTEAASHGFTRTGVIPFDFYRKRVSVMVSKGRVRLLITKGAPEDIIKLSTSHETNGTVVKMTPVMRKKLLARVDAYGREGLRVLGVAYVSNGKEEKNLTFLGYMAFLDPAKKTVAASLLRLTRHSIGIKILTGDSDVVTQKICSDIGLTAVGVLRGEELDTLSDVELSKRVETTTIFARVNPDMKLRVIAALRKNGHVVGYMGDGINDAPGIRAADVGISVNNASDVAKLSADIILLHKDLHVLMEGVHEGRVTFANVLKYLKMNISSDFGNMVSIAVASVFLPFLPMLPVQVLLNDMLYDVSQLTLASDSVEEKYLRLPRKWDVHNIRKFMLVFGPASSVFDLVTFGILLWIFHARPEFFQTGWFLESVITQTLIIFSIRTQAVPFYKSHPSKLFAFSLFAVVALAIALPYLPLASGFSFVRMPPVYFVILIGLLAAYLILVERLKQWFYRSADV